MADDRSLSHGSLLIARAVKEQFPQADAKTTAQAFLHSPSTTVYRGIEFDPRETTPDYLSLWVGPTIEPAACDTKEIKRFLLEIICAKDPHAYMGLDHRSGRRTWVIARGPHSGPYGSWAHRRVCCADRSPVAGSTINAPTCICSVTWPMHYSAPGRSRAS